MCYYKAVMVRIINKNNVPLVANFAYMLMKTQELFTYMADWNNPNIDSCVYVLWHENQFALHGLPNRKNISILISNSLDGEIIARVVEKWGFKTSRGSAQRKGAVTATLQMISRLKDGESVAIMVDGPRGPYHKVKHGAIVLAKEAGVPIVPVHWVSFDPTFCHLPSWDKMTSPIGPCRLLNMYGDPIYLDNKTDEQVAQEIKQSLDYLKSHEKEFYNKAKELKLWSKKK